MRVEIKSECECESDHRATHLANAAEWKRRYFECKTALSPECDPAVIWRMMDHELTLANATMDELP
jgi:hypothetical protein